MLLRPLHSRYLHNLQTHPQHLPRIQRMNNTIIQNMRRRTIALALPLHPRPQLRNLPLPPFLHLLPTTLILRRPALNRLHHPRQLIRPHDRTPPTRPTEQKPRPVTPPTHRIVPRAVTRAHDQTDVRHLAHADRAHELRALLDDACVLRFGSDHEAGHVVQEDDGEGLLVAEADELGAFQGFVGVDDGGRVGDDAAGVGVDGGEGGDEVAAVGGFEEGEAGVVDEPEEDFGHGEGFADVGVDEGEEVGGGVARWWWG